MVCNGVCVQYVIYKRYRDKVDGLKVGKDMVDQLGWEIRQGDRV